MAELKIESLEASGIKKEIDAGAIELILSGLQEDIYSYPIRSFVREAVSNGLDAIVERKIAREIIDKGVPKETYYRQKQDGALLKDSEFDPEYYDLDYLSKDDNQVECFYEKGEHRDLMHIKDFGVGLGGSRLQGFFKIGYSSKRNMKDVFGKFGAGAKAGLSTGVEYFTLVTTYNGYRTSFMIYKHDYESITPEHKNGKSEVWFVRMADDSHKTRDIYWEPTEDANSVEIILPVKKHNMKAFVDAVIQQFSYFPGKVSLRRPYYHTEGYTYEDFSSEPHYNSENILIPRESPYSAPHIIVDGINYGLISWQELELENRVGCVGIRVTSAEVDITQSRESLKWTDKTKKAINDKIGVVRDEASEYVTKLIEDSAASDSVFEKINTLMSIKKSSENATAIEFSRFLDMTSITPSLVIPYKYKNDETRNTKSLPIDDDTFKALFHKFQFTHYTSKLVGNDVKVVKEKVRNFDSIAHKKVVFAEATSLTARKAITIMDDLSVSEFLYIRERTVDSWDGNYYEYIHNQVRAHSDVFLDNYMFNFDEVDKISEESEGETIVKVKKETLAQIRKRNAQVLVTEFELVQEYRWDGKHNDVYRRSIVGREDVKISSIPYRFNKSTIICTQKYKALGDIILASEYFTGKRYDLIFVAKDNVKYFLPHCTFITDYLKTYNKDTKTIMIGEAFKEINTLRKIKAIQNKYNSFSADANIIKSLTTFDKERYLKYIDSSKSTTIQQELKRSYTDFQVTETVFKYLDKLAEIQTIIKTESDETIASESKRLLGGEILHVEAFDENFVNDVEAQLERLNPLAAVLKYTSLSGANEDEKSKFKDLVNKILPLIS